MGMRHAAGLALVLSALAPAWAGEPLRDDVPMTPERRAEAGKELSRKRPSKPPLDKSKVELSFDFSLEEPAKRSDLEALSGPVSPRDKDALMKALLDFAAPKGSEEVRAKGCCLRLRYAGCVYFCCGSRESHCQDSCRLSYCEAR